MPISPISHLTCGLRGNSSLVRHVVQFANQYASYGGHYGPGFYNYFYQQNEGIKNGSVKGVELQMDTLGIINGIIDEQIQAPYYPEFAVNNTYGIKLSMIPSTLS